MGCKELDTTEQLGTAHGGDGKCPFPQSNRDASVIQGHTLLQVFSEIEGCSQELSQRGSAILVALLLIKAENWGGRQISLHLFKNHHYCYFYLFFLSAVHACRIFVPQSWIQLCLLQWKHIVPATDPPGKFLSLPLTTISKESFIHCCGLEHEQLSPGKKLLTQIKCHE